MVSSSAGRSKDWKTAGRSGSGIGYLRKLRSKSCQVERHCNGIGIVYTYFVFVTYFPDQDVVWVTFMFICPKNNVRSSALSCSPTLLKGSLLQSEGKIQSKLLSINARLAEGFLGIQTELSIEK